MEVKHIKKKIKFQKNFQFLFHFVFSKDLWSFYEYSVFMLLKNQAH